MNSKYPILAMVFSTLPLSSATANENTLAVSQGISSPTTNPVVNYSNGYTHENPMGAAFADSIGLTLQYDKGDSTDTNNNSGYGCELAIGNGDLGLAVGYNTRNCDNCEGQTAIAVGGVFSGIGIGLRLNDDRRTAGLLFGAEDTHRVGITAEIFAPSTLDNQFSAIGLGYAYVSSTFTLALDASKRQFENKDANSDVIIVTPGILARFSQLSLSVSYDARINDDETEDLNTDNNLWWGVGFGSKSDWHLSLYSDYLNKWAVALSLFF